MDFTTIVAERFHLSPFAVLQEDKDSVIMLINYYVEKGDEEQTNMKINPEKKHGAKPERIQVNDKTASGGWF